MKAALACLGLSILAAGPVAAQAENAPLLRHDLYWTNWWQGSVDGPPPDGLKAGGRFDLYLDADTHKLFGWTGSAFSGHLDYRYGSSSQNQGGGFLPTNGIAALPLGSKDRLIVSSLHLVQKLDGWQLRAGKINTVDLLAGKLMMGGRGLDGPMNINLVAPISGLVPPTIFGAIAIVPGSPNWTLMLFDPNDQTRKSGLERPFADGVNVGVTASWPAPFTAFGGSHSVSVHASSARGSDLSDEAVFVPVPGQTAGTQRGKWNLAYEIEQLLNPRWGFFAKLSKADANPNFHDYSYQFGLGGKGLLESRPQDRWVLGAFGFALSRIARDAVSPPLPLRAERGVEAFYGWQIGPGLTLAADLQWVRPHRKDRVASTFVGTRVVARF